MQHTYTHTAFLHLFRFNCSTSSQPPPSAAVQLQVTIDFNSHIHPSHLSPHVLLARPFTPRPCIPRPCIPRPFFLSFSCSPASGKGQEDKVKLITHSHLCPHICFRCSATSRPSPSFSRSPASGCRLPRRPSSHRLTTRCVCLCICCLCACACCLCVFVCVAGLA